MIKDMLDRAALENFQKTLGHHFKNIELLRLALTHSSWAHCQGDHLRSNERLEFLGDAVLELCVSSFLFHHFSEAPEGKLTSMRSHLVNGRSLGEIAISLGIPDLMRKSIGAEWQGAKQRQSLGADALEAVIAAVYLDSGFPAAMRVAERLFHDSWDGAGQTPSRKNSKNALQEETMRLFHALPNYRIVSESGPEHAKVFGALACLPDGREFYGEGGNRKKAEQAAAAKALDNLNKS